MLSSLFDPIYTSTFTVTDYLICTTASLLLGFLLAFIYSKTTKTNRSTLMTVSILPVVVQTVIMMVNGSIGAGLAVAGSFSLVKFRSVQYKSEDILAVFASVALGLANAVGYVGMSALFTIIVGLLFVVFRFLSSSQLNAEHMLLKITVPESLNYSEAFDETLSKFTSSYELVNTRTTNMGSLFKISYDIVLLDKKNTQAFINEIRMRNGNLEVSVGAYPNEVGA